MRAPSLQPALASLRRLRSVMRLSLVLQRGLWLIALALSVGVGLGLLDYALRLPSAVRGGLLALGLALLGISIWRRVLLAWRFRPPLEELALRLESLNEPGPQAVDLLASGVDFAGHPGTHAPPLARAMGERVVALAGALTPTFRLTRVLRWKPVALAAGAACACALGITALGMTSPELAGIGARRVLLPWSAATWPKRSAVYDLTAEEVHPLGTALSLRALMHQRGAGRASDRVEATYRLIGPDGTTGPSRRVVLTSQERPATARNRAGDTVEGVLHERILEAAALELDPDLTASETTQIEYALETSDDQSEARRITLVRPPAVVGASVRTSPPAYAASVPDFEPRTADLGTGTDQRATLAGVLAGSRVELSITLNKAVPTPATDAPPEMLREWLAAALGEQFASAVADRDATLDARFEEGLKWTIAWTLDQSLRLPVRAVDRFGVQSDGESILRIEVRADRPPEATVIKPDQDVEVLASASVEVVVEARDDVAVDSLAAEYRVARRAAGSVGAAPEPDADYVVLTATPESGRTLNVASRLDLDALKAKPGEEYWITALAHDAYELRGERHEGVRSAVRKVRVISEQQLTDQVWAELGGVRRTAQRLAEQQQTARAATEQAKDPGPIARDQAAITEGATRQDQVVSRLRERLDANSLNDTELSAVLNEARASLEQAREASAGAGQRLKEAKAAGESRDEPAASAATAKATEDQDRAQSALESLAELLDKGQDTWSVKRGLERLLQEQKALRDATSTAAKQSVGKPLEDLTPQQRQQTEQLGDQQEELARRAEEALRKMREKAEQMKETDPAAAAAMNDAAQRGRSANVPEQMEKAAKDIRTNKQQSANQQQDRATKALQDMLEQLEQAAKSRDQTLARQLASLIESIEGLIARQTGEIAALQRWADGGPSDGLDAPMIRLRTLTLGTAEQARAAGREARGVAGPLDAAAGAQGEAVTGIRATGASAEAVKTHEELSLAKLNEALERANEAQQQAQDRNARAERAELRKGYRELLDLQTDVRVRTDDVAKMEAGRRQRAAARELAEPQDRVRTLAAEMEQKTKEIGEADMFRFAHKRLDDAAGFAAQRLTEGEAGPAVRARQASAIRVLQGVLDALADTAQRPDDFRENAGGQGQGQGQGQGGGGQPKLIPPAAELKLLRGMQAEALELTRLAADDVGNAATRDEASQLQAGLAERAASLLQKLKDEEAGGGGGPVQKPVPNN
ncbi:MAG: hypothetical protein ACKVS8_02570 [Phycisphaerales bacterium]